MKVRAKFKANKFGYIHDVRRRNGDEFTIEPREYSEKWMVVIEGQKELDDYRKVKAKAEAGEEEPKPARDRDWETS